MATFFAVEVGGLGPVALRQSAYICSKEADTQERSAVSIAAAEAPKHNLDKAQL